MGDPAEICREIYKEMKSFYGSDIHESCHFGFKILYGPPLFQAPVLFIGYQPGGGIEDYRRELEIGAHDSWPQRNEYADETRTWTLARNMRAMFGKAFLESCVGLNAIFIRSPSIQCYEASVDRNVRLTIQQFCFHRVLRIIDALQPQRIVVIGLGTLALFGEGQPDLISEKGLALTRVGEILGRKALAVQHLSAVRISSANRIRIRDRILAF
jgi:hypothetical protein